MELLFTKNAWNEYLFWQVNNTKIVNRINLLIKEIMRTPFIGIGKPEALKCSLAGYWSRRINDEHRLVYKVENSKVYIIQCKFHY